MADATVRVSVVPDGVDQDIDTIVTDLLAEGLDAVTADPGNDLVVSADIVHSEAADSDGSAGEAAIDAAITAVGDIVKVGSTKVEADPTLSSPANVSLDVSDGDHADIVWDLALSEDANLVSIVVDVSALESTTARKVFGDPQGHQSQVRSDGKVILRVGPATATHAAQTVSLVVTDSNGRSSAADEVTVTAVA
jgi:hypothetical protein